MFISKKLMMTKKNYLYDRFFVSNQNFTIKHVKRNLISVFSRFFSDFYSKCEGFFLISQIPSFSRIEGFVATLYLKQFYLIK